MNADDVDSIEIDQFSSAKKVISYAGFDTSTRQSGKKETLWIVLPTGVALQIAYTIYTNPGFLSNIWEEVSN